MTRGTKFLNNSKCKCGCCGKTDRPYAHMSKSGHLYLKGYCHKCGKIKSLPYTQEQLEMEGAGIRDIFKKVWSKAIKPLAKEVGKNILNNPTRALEVATQLGTAAASRNPGAIARAGVSAGRFGVLGKGVRIGELTDGRGLYLAPRK